MIKKTTQNTAFSHHLWAAYFFNPRREVLNEQLAQVVEGLEFAGLENRQMERRLGRRLWTLWWLCRSEESRLWERCSRGQCLRRGRGVVVCLLLTTVSSRPFKSCLVCSWRSCRNLTETAKPIQGVFFLCTSGQCNTYVLFRVRETEVCQFCRQINCNNEEHQESFLFSSCT